MDFAKNEKQILKFWEKEKVFEKLREKNKKGKPWSFLDGPITANNPMGVHHAWGRTYKDLFQRYKAMRGFHQRFQNGFDCQGLWVEVEVEKELGFKNKKDIEKYGIDKFVEKCKERVMKYSKIQTQQSIRLGQWMDWDNSYYTMSDENNYAIWHFLKKCHQKGLLYKGRDSVAWCPRCGTAISQHEILTEEYKELTHKAVYVKFKVISGLSASTNVSAGSRENTYFLGWTTTPWTLPGNVALAVQPELDYVKVKDEQGDVYILLKEKAELIEQGKVLEELKGKKLEGIEYKGLFDDLPAVKEALGDFEHKVILWKDITAEEGTGVVHIAPGCGAEDFQLAKDLDLPVIDLSDAESNYREGFDELTGKFVGAAQTREWVFNNLQRKDGVFKIEDYTHRYPTCWRCKSELIFRVVNEWYIAMDKLRKPLIESAKKIKWMPEFGLDRELDWLKNMKDWLISKKRYWGLALPIFECSCGNFEVIGSKEELKKRAVEGWDKFEGHSPHRPWIDNVKIKCSKCGVLADRVKDVGTPWLDAGIVPFSTMGYFKDKKEWQKWFPADFITESFPGQFKNWFYVLLVMSQVLENKPPFEQVLGFATVVDEKGEEMHKSKGNAIWFDEGVEKIGADVMRWMYAKQNPSANMRFGYNIADETKKKLLTLINCCAFYNYNSPDKTKKIKTKSLLDKWILSCFHNLIKQTTESLDNFDAMRASQAIERFFIEDLSLWYIRRSRKRFDKAAPVLYFVLLNLAKLIAPIMPFLAENVFQQLRTSEQPQSVHLCDWPAADEEAINKGLEEEMSKVREIVSLALSERTEKDIRVRQPLSQLRIKDEKLKYKKELLDLIKEEVNVKKVFFDVKIKKEVEFDTKITKKLQQEGNLREVIRTIQALRKQANLTPQDKAVVLYSGARELMSLVEANQKEILKATRSTEIRPEAGGGNEKTIKIDNQTLILGIVKL